MWGTLLGLSKVGNDLNVAGFGLLVGRDFKVIKVFKVVCVVALRLLVLVVIVAIVFIAAIDLLAFGL